ncbi:MAG: TPR repeat protein [Myxococcota bacterium]|jgi:TPR repeat protein
MILRKPHETKTPRGNALLFMLLRWMPIPKPVPMWMSASVFSLLLASMLAVLAASSAVYAQEGGELAAAKRLVAQGQVAGYYRLGRVYELGREVEKDLFEAARQYQVAAEMDHHEAQFSLGLLLTGAVKDAPRSPRKSFEWFSKAADGGHMRAGYFLAMSFESGVGTEPNSERAFEWYRRAATSGDAEAMEALARMYEEGAGIRQNLANAYAWNHVAGVRGFDGAEERATQLEAQMDREEIQRGKKLSRSLVKKYGRVP